MYRILKVVTLASATLVAAANPASAHGTERPAGHRDPIAVVRPGESIQAALDSAQPGTTVKIRPGRYAEQLVITKSGIRLEGDRAELVPPPTPTPNACTGVTVVGPPDPTSPPADAAVCIVGDVVFGAYDPFVKAKAVTVRHAVNDVQVSGLRISGFAAGVIIAGANETVITRNTIEVFGPYGLLALTSPQTTFSRNVLTGAADALAAVGACMDKSPSSDMSGNNVSRFLFGICVSTSGMTVRGNDVHDNTIGIAVDVFVGDVRILQNNVHDNNQANPAGIPAGIGIIVAGSHDVRIEHNNVTGNSVDNRATSGPSGGIIVVDDGDHNVAAANISVTRNRIVGNGDGTFSNDLTLLGSGPGNTATRNTCLSSFPAGLCSL